MDIQQTKKRKTVFGIPIEYEDLYFHYSEGLGHQVIGVKDKAFLKCIRIVEAEYYQYDEGIERLQAQIERLGFIRLAGFDSKKGW